jgi:hypothetical protein
VEKLRCYRAQGQIAWAAEKPSSPVSKAWYGSFGAQRRLGGRGASHRGPIDGWDGFAYRSGLGWSAAATRLDPRTSFADVSYFVKWTDGGLRLGRDRWAIMGVAVWRCDCV